MKPNPEPRETKSTGYSVLRTEYPVLLFCLCLLAVPAVSFADPGEPTVNFTVRKKTEPKQTVPGTDVSTSEPPVAPLPELPVRSEPVEERTEPLIGPEAEPTAPEIPIFPSESVWLEGEHSHPSAKGIQSHVKDLAAPAAVSVHGMIVQQVWLDPNDPPRGIALQFMLSTGEEVGVYWEGEQEVFNPADYQELWYYGMLPELGNWTSLEILAEDLGLEDSQITGIRFVTFDGRALWDKMILTEAPPLEGLEPQPVPGTGTVPGTE